MLDKFFLPCLPSQLEKNVIDNLNSLSEISLGDILEGRLLKFEENELKGIVSAKSVIDYYGCLEMIENKLVCSEEYINPETVSFIKHTMARCKSLLSTYIDFYFFVYSRSMKGTLDNKESFLDDTSNVLKINRNIVGKDAVRYIRLLERQFIRYADKLSLNEFNKKSDAYTLMIVVLDELLDFAKTNEIKEIIYEINSVYSSKIFLYMYPNGVYHKDENNMPHPTAPDSFFYHDDLKRLIFLNSSNVIYQRMIHMIRIKSHVEQLGVKVGDEVYNLPAHIINLGARMRHS